MRTAASRSGRVAVAGLLTPGGERAIRRIGYRRVLLAGTVLAAAVIVPAALLIGVALSSAPAAGTVAVASSVLSSATEVFGERPGSDGQLSGADLADAAESAPQHCAPQPAASPAPAPVAAAEPADSIDGPPSETPAPTGVAPIQLGEQGQIDTADAHLLVDPVLPGTGSLMAYVWFMYRLAGLGDWDTFTAAYQAAGLDAADPDPQAPLRQVQALNTASVDTEPYRLTAAALTVAAQTTGRVTDPYPQFRDVMSAELLGDCLRDPETLGGRMELPQHPPPSAPAVE